jgi:hypothetical protein
MIAAALAGLGVPAAAAAVWRDTLARHPVAAAGLALAYGALLGVVALARKAAARPADRRLEQLGEAVDRALGRRLSRYGRRYREHVATSMRRIDTKGLATVGPHTPELDEVFVDVGLAPRAPHQVPGGVLADVPEDVTHRYALCDLLDHERPAALAVIGAPGSGKTTLLRHVARQAARARRRRRPVPILLVLRDHAEQIAANQPATLPQVLRASLGDLPAREPDGWWEHQLGRGACLVLMDGLDEVARSEDRRAVADWIERQITLYPGNDYVVTSRPHGYQATVIAQASVLQVRPFTDEQVRRFLHGWYLAAERHAASEPGPDVERHAQAEAADMLARLAATPGIHDLTVNPLLLTMIANVHRHRGALPGSRADLYGEVCQVMLWRSQEAKKLAADLPGWASKERLLAQLAYTMMRQRVGDLPREQALDAVRRGLRRVSKAATAEGFLADVSNNGLLVERERDLYAFAHHTFGEYLAARHIKDNGLAQVLADAVDDMWWRETTLFYAAGGDADPIVWACLDSGTVTALALAFDCADGGELAPELRDQLEKTLAEAFDAAADPDRRRLVAGVLATRHLRSLVTTAAGARVCPQPVTADIYWLFLQDTQTATPGAPTPLAPDPCQVATGLWGKDALAFAAWVNTITANAGDPIYRLPTHAELLELADKAALASPLSTDLPPGGAWTSPETEQTMPGLWTPAGGRDPRIVTGTEILAAAANDAASSAVLLQLALGRVSDSAIRLARDLDLARDLARDLDLALARALARDLALARALARDLVLARDLARDLDLDLAIALAGARALARALPVPLPVTSPVTSPLPSPVPVPALSTSAVQLWGVGWPMPCRRY